MSYILIPTALSLEFYYQLASNEDYVSKKPIVKRWVFKAKKPMFYLFCFVFFN